MIGIPVFSPSTRTRTMIVWFVMHKDKGVDLSEVVPKCGIVPVDGKGVDSSLLIFKCK